MLVQLKFNESTFSFLFSFSTACAAPYVRSAGSACKGFKREHLNWHVRNNFLITCGSWKIHTAPKCLAMVKLRRALLMRYTGPRFRWISVILPAKNSLHCVHYLTRRSTISACRSCRTSSYKSTSREVSDMLNRSTLLRTSTPRIGKCAIKGTYFLTRPVTVALCFLFQWLDVIWQGHLTKLI